MSEFWASRSTILPLPSSPHCAPTITVPGMSRKSRRAVGGSGGLPRPACVVVGGPPRSVGVREERVHRVVVGMLRQGRGLEQSFEPIPELIGLRQDVVERGATGADIEHAGPLSL